MKRIAIISCSLLCFSIIAFGQVNLNLGLQAYYPFTGNANDVSGNNNNPVFNNATLTTDRFGNANSAYSFNGVNNYMRIPNSPSLNSGNQISICVWVKVEGYYSGPCHGNSIVMKGDDDFLPGNYLLRFDDNPYTMGQNCINPIPDQLHQNFYGGGAIGPNGGYTPFITTDHWQSVVYTADGTTCKIYVDCKLKGFGDQNALTTFTNPYDLYFGKLVNPNYPYWFNGVLDEVRIYNRALNEEEVKAYGECPLTNNGVDIGGIINSYTSVQSFDFCKNKLTVEDPNPFSVGDTVMLIQMKGAVIDSTNTVNFGTITNYKNAGNYEFNYIQSISGSVIELKNNLTHQYDVPDGKVQLVRVPYFQNANIISTLTCLPWDGNKGGVLVLNAANSITLNADINVNGRGFHKGPGYNPQDQVLDCGQNDYRYPISANNHAGQKGEGIATISQNIICGKGPLANGGGGGLGHNSGGGGGGNGGIGGYGGYQLDNCGNAPFDNRGIGGRSMAIGFEKIFLGGGGGAGEADNINGPLPSGGNGGGIIIISGNGLTTNGFKIRANGDSGLVCTAANCHDAMGGGGGGGTILLDVNQYLDNTVVESKGGKGADMTGSVPLGGRIGAGGGGGAGILYLKSTGVPANITSVNTGGANGVLVTDGNSSWGATPGSNGDTLYNLVLHIDNIPYKPNIDSVRIKDSMTNCKTFDFKGLGYTNTSPIASWQWYFGDGGTANTQNTSHTYTTANTFTVKLVITDVNGCKDSITKNVTTLVNPSFDFGYQINACNGLSVQFNGLGSSTQNPYWDFGDGGTNTGTLNPTHVYASENNYTVKYAVGSGACTDTVKKTISLFIVQDDIVLTHDTTICAGTTKQLLTKTALNFCWTPTTYLNNPNSPNPITSTPQNITYYFTAQIQGNNLIVNGDFSGGNTGFTSQYNYANPNTTEGEYFVGPNPQAWNASLSACRDHTTGTGNMMLVNGAPTPNVNVWKQTITVTPNTNYAFSTWIQALWPPNPAQLSFSINGSDIGNLITASLPTCTWTQFYTTWNSGNNTSATISIVNKNTFVIGNDFALDDISFAPVLIKRDSVKITVDTPLVRTSNDATVCEGVPVQLNTTGAATYTWTPAGGLSNAGIGNPIATPTVTTQYIVTGTTVNGCVAKDTVNININARPVIAITNDTTICKNIPLQLSSSGGGTYSWSPAAGLNNPSIANPVATTAAPIKYYLTVTGSNTCTSIDSVSVGVHPDPIFTVSPATNVCLTKSVQISAGGGDTYTWTPGNMNIANPVVSPTTNTNYSVLITDTVCHNSTTLSTTVTVLPLPNVQAGKLNDIDCSNSSSQLRATGASQYVWTPATGLSNPNIANPVASPSVTTQYTVKGTDANNCSNTALVTVDITGANQSLYLMPSAFTPNGDGLNDCFGIKYWGVITKLDFAIYNRWGEKIFHTTKPGDCWDGVYKGQIQGPDVFVYLITAETTCGKVFRKGTFALIR